MNCTCGKELSVDEADICKICNEPVCEECQAKYNQFSQIDYGCHQDCVDSWSNQDQLNSF